MHLRLSLLALLPLVGTLGLTGCLPDSPGTPVRVTLDQGQLLVGDVHEGRLTLDSPLGALDIPLSDIGEVEPVEGQDLAGSGDHVRVWLRDGSELVGRWAEPELDVSLAIGGGSQSVSLPMDDVQRLQLTGQAEFPEAGAFRVKTAFGDDLFVDAAETVLPLDTQLGALAPRLDEVASLRPLGEPGRWRVELRSGTVLNGTMSADTLSLSLRMGPPSVDVAVADLLSVDRMTYDPNLWSAPAPAAAEATDNEGWYDISGSGMRSQKLR